MQRHFKQWLFTLAVLIFSMFLCSCENDTQYESYMERNVFDAYFYDEANGITIADYGDLVVLKSCDQIPSKFVLPTEFENDVVINYVGDHSFNYVDNLVEVVVPDGYEEVGQFAFRCCDNLKNVHIGKDVHTIRDLAFSECPKLSKFSVSLENPYLYEKNGCVLTKQGNRLIASNGNIPDGTTIIGACVFGGNTTISDIIIPESVTVIQGYAFDRSSLTKVKLPESLQKIEEYAFSQCMNLKEIYIPKNVTEIGVATFSGTDGLIINCAAESKPESWADEWLVGCENYQLNWGVHHNT